MSTSADLTATELLAAYRTGELSPVEATQDVLDRIDQLDREVRAFCFVDADQALDAAKASEQRWQQGLPQGLVDGVPTSIKDMYLTQGWPTLRGSRLVSPDRDGQSTGRRWLGCANTVRCCWARRPPPSWPGNASPTARSPASRSTRGTPAGRRAGRAGVAPWRWRWAWGRCRWALTGVVRCASLRPSPPRWRSSRLTVACRTGRPARWGPWRTPGRYSHGG